MVTPFCPCSGATTFTAALGIVLRADGDHNGPVWNKMDASKGAPSGFAHEPFGASEDGGGLEGVSWSDDDKAEKDSDGEECGGKASNAPTTSCLPLRVATESSHISKSDMHAAHPCYSPCCCATDSNLS